MWRGDCCAFEYLRRTGTAESAVGFALAEHTLDQIEQRSLEADRGLSNGTVVAIQLPSGWIQKVDQRIVDYASSNQIKILKFEMRAGVTEVFVRAEDAERMRKFVKALSERR